MELRRTVLRPGSSWREAVPILALILAAAVAGGVAGGLAGGFTDLHVYVHGGRSVLPGLPVPGSADPVTGLSFTYPPFAAVAMVPLSVLPGWLAAALWTAASAAALVVVVRVALRAQGHLGSIAVVALLAAGALAMEPVWQNFAFGQVNLFLMAAVLVDLLRVDRRWSGILIGLAAGLKLTPLVFVLLLVLVGRRSAALRATLAFAVTVAVGFAVVPGWARTYWTDGLLDAGRVGPPALAHNQSVYGVLTRLLDGPPPGWLWVGIAAPLCLAILFLATVRWRGGDRLLGVGLAALAMLLASPISWSHHWVWAVPISLALWERQRWLGLAWVAVFVARPIVWAPYGRGREYGWNVPEQIVGNAYVLAALAVAAWAFISWMVAIRAPRSSDFDPERPRCPTPS